MKKIKKGYTLLEVLMVIVVVGILSVFSIATFDGYRKDAGFAKSLAFEKQLRTDMMASYKSYVAFWTFRFVENDGSITDLSGEKNHITLPASVQRIDTDAYYKLAEPYSLAFDGTGSGLEISGNTEIPRDKITISLWFKLNRHKNYNQLYRYIDSRILIRIANNGLICFNMGNPGDRTNVCYDEEIDLDTWYHVGAVYDGQMMQLYINGEVVAEEEKIGYDLNPTGGTRMWLGRGNALPGSVLDGYIDNVYVWGNSFSWD